MCAVWACSLTTRWTCAFRSPRHTSTYMYLFFPHTTSTSAGSKSSGTSVVSRTGFGTCNLLSRLRQWYACWTAAVNSCAATASLNAAADLICDLHPRDSVTSALIGLHWLPVPARVELNCVVTPWLCMLQPVSTLQRTTGLRSAYCDLFTPRTPLWFGEREPSARQPVVSGTRFRLTSVKPTTYRHSRKTEDVLVL